MKRLFLLALLVVLDSVCLFAQIPIVRAHLEPADHIMVGQPVRLVVSVFVPNYFTGSPNFPELEMENAIVVLPQDRPENSNTQIRGATYFGITQTYVIYPQQAGDFHIPPAKLSVPYAIAPPKSTTAQVSLPSLSFRADIPAAAEGLPYFLPTTRLTMTQHWSRPLKGLRTGDSVERTITVTATKMQAMLIPPLPFDQPNGVRVYPAEPVVRDQKTDRGDFVYGQRVQTAKYLIQKPGDYLLPPIDLRWWDLDAHRLITAILPETKFTAVVNPNYVVELPPPEEHAIPATEKVTSWKRYRSMIRLGLETIAGAFVLLLAVQIFRPAWARLAKWWKDRKISETACFHKLLRAARANNAQQTYVDLIRWFGMTRPGVPLHDAIKASADTTLGREISHLAEILYGRHDRNGSKDSTSLRWEGAELATRLKQLRRFLNAKRNRRATQNALDALNP